MDGIDWVPSLISLWWCLCQNAHFDHFEKRLEVFKGGNLYNLQSQYDSFICTIHVHYRIIVIMQNYLPALNMLSTYQVYFVECLTKMRPIFLIILYHLYDIWGCVFSAYPIFFGWLGTIYVLYRISIIRSKKQTISHCLGWVMKQ